MAEEVVRDEPHPAETGGFPFELLPVEIQAHVLGCVPPLDLLLHAPLVCREWRALTADEAVWQAVHQRAFGGPPPDDIDDDLFDDDDNDDDIEPKETDYQSGRWRKLTRSILETMKRRWPQTWRDVGTQVVHEEWLAWAIGQGHTRIVLPLLRGRPPAELAGLPPGLMVAAGRSANLELLALLEPHIGVNVVEGTRAMTALHQACLHGHAEAVHWLLEQGAEVDKANDVGKTALMYAAENGADRVVADLLAHGADPRVKAGEDYRHVTALHLAAGSGSLKTARMLLAAGADILATTRQDYTALAYAASKGDEPMLELLLEQVEATDPTWREPAVQECLTIAAERGHLGLVLCLLKGGAPRSCWCVPLRVALANNNLDVAAALVDHGADVNHPYGLQRLLDTYHSGPAAAFLAARGAKHSLYHLLRTAVHREDVEAARALLTNPPPPPFVMYSLLRHVVLYQGNAEMARLLLQHGATWRGGVSPRMPPRLVEVLLSFAPNI